MSDVNFRDRLHSYDDSARAYRKGVGAIRQEGERYEEDLVEALIKVNHAVLALVSSATCQARTTTEERVHLYDLSAGACAFDAGAIASLVAAAEARGLALDTAQKRLAAAQKELDDLIGRQKADMKKASESLTKAADEHKKK